MTLLDPYNNSLSFCFKCSENFSDLNIYSVLSSATDDIGFCSFRVMQKRDQILSTAKISTALAAIS